MAIILVRIRHLIAPMFHNSFTKQFQSNELSLKYQKSYPIIASI